MELQKLLTDLGFPGLVDKLQAEGFDARSLLVATTDDFVECGIKRGVAVTRSEWCCLSLGGSSFLIHLLS
eukprot:m.501711 g.501711  ORF g.501711 m.501711 type:complete len:70 (-) comp57333_c0_seq14:2352-2561(-)